MRSWTGNKKGTTGSREIDKDSDFILAIQTVRGLDVGAVEFAHKKMIEERDKGKGILMISLDLDEAFSVSDRVLVIYEGEIVKDILTKDVTVNELGLYMAGVKKDKIPEVKFDSRELKIVKERSGVYEKK